MVPMTMKIRIIEKIKQCINYYKNPRYAIFSGIKLNNQIFFLAKNCTVNNESPYIMDVIRKCSIKGEHREQYYRSSLFVRIWTFQDLIKTYRIIKNDGFAKSWTVVRKPDFWTPIEKAKYVQ